jgi:U6 snRNA-associated Sm-like protein LSm6
MQGFTKKKNSIKSSTTNHSHTTLMQQTSSTSKKPTDFLKQVIGRPVTVKLYSGVEYRGILACLDGYMNIVLEQTQEYKNGQLTNSTYNDAFIRGNNVYYISSSTQ